MPRDSQAYRDQKKELPLTGPKRSSSARAKMSLTEADSVLKSLWDRDVAAWDRYWVPVFSLFARELVADASLSAGDVVLDLGTGSGLAAIEACKAVPSLGVAIGIDRSEAMIRLARKKAARAHLRNARFHEMTAEDLHFPNEFFDAVISNCGIDVAEFSNDLKEVLRVLKPGGVFVFNDWHLIDVKPHRVFGEVLGEYRTLTPSPRLARERLALASTESYSRSLSSEGLLEMVHDAEFRRPRLTNRRYKVRMRGTRDYMRMRLCRATIRREISEMSPTQHRLFLSELRKRLQEFVKRNSFVFDWPVFYIHAEKPS